jgi:hypothetical protein
MKDLMYRSEFLLKVLDKYCAKDDHILEIGCADGRNVDFLRKNGYIRVEGIDKINGTAIEDVEPKKYDVIFTMSTLFLIKDDTVFEKIANMAEKYIITIEGETSVNDELVGRDYSAVFIKHGFQQVEEERNVFNVYGVLRVMKKQ